MARLGQHLGHRAAFNDLARIHDHDLVAEIGHDADVVRHQHHGEFQPLLQLAQHVEDLALDDDVERRHRLVASSRLGSSARAMAMAARWRMPPENWCG